MCKAVEDYGKKKMREGVIDTIRSFIKDGSLSVERIAEIVKLPIDEVKKIAATV